MESDSYYLKPILVARTQEEKYKYKKFMIV